MSKRQQKILNEVDQRIARVEDSKKFYGELDVLKTLENHFKTQRANEAQKIGLKKS